MTEKNKVSISLDGPSSAAAPRFATQLRLRALEPKRRKRFTAADEVRAFLFIAMLLLALAISALARTDDPVAAILRFFAPLLPN